MGNDQAQEGRRRRQAGQALRQADQAGRSRGPSGRRRSDSNPTLRTMFQKARDNSVPLDTIERAVKRGTGELEGVNYESITYEGYAPAAWRC